MSPPELARLTFVLLRRPADAPDYPEERLEEIQRQHLAHLDAMRERGALLVAGPFGDQPDDTWRGLCLYRTDLDETRQLAAQDPAVVAGRLSVEVFSWYHPAGQITFG